MTPVHGLASATGPAEQHHAFEPCGPGHGSKRHQHRPEPNALRAGSANGPQAVFKCKGLRSAGSVGTSGAGEGPRDGEVVAGSEPVQKRHGYDDALCLKAEGLRSQEAQTQLVG